MIPNQFSFSLLNVDYVQLGKKWNYSNIVSPYYRMYYIDKGTGVISCPTKKLILKPGFLYLIPSFTVCDLNCSEFLSQYFIQFFEKSPNGISLFQNNRNIMEVEATDLDVELFQMILKINPGRGINRSDDPKVYEKEAYYKEYRNLNRNMRAPVQYKTQGIIMMLLSRFIEAPEFKTMQSGKIPSVVLNAMNYIQINLGNTITIQELAKNAHQNSDYFSRYFLEHTGQRPLSYIHEKRIERSQYLLVTTDKTLLDIALETGFTNLPHFTKIFKKKVNTTPGKYRKQSLQIT